MSAERIKEAARAWLNAACYEAEVREGITGHITRAYEQFESEVDALAARLSGLQDEAKAATDARDRAIALGHQTLADLAAACASLSGLQDTLERERKARHAAETLSAEEVLRRRTNLEAQIASLEAQVSGLQDTLAAKDEALRFYADESNYDEQAPPPGSFDGPVPVPDDRGAVARAALALSADGPGSVPGDAPTEKGNSDE